MPDDIQGISVIIPTWNRVETLERAINSALKQTLPPEEILVCDDGSTDGSELLVRAFNNEKIRWLPGARGGCPAIPRNRGLRASKCPWIAFLDSDDIWLPNKLQAQFEALKQTGLLAASSNAFRYVANSYVGDLLQWNRATINVHELLLDNKIVCSSAIVHRSILDITGGFPETHNLKVGEDYTLWLKVASLTKFAYISVPLVIYYDNPTDSARKDAPQHWVQKKRVLNYFLGWCWQRNKITTIRYSFVYLLVLAKYLCNKTVNKLYAYVINYKKKNYL